jgi:NADH oxidase (H2O-forming)
MDNKILKISDSVKWIGLLDKELRTFDIIMETKYGTTYNSYFINAQKKVVVETVKEKFFDIFEAKLRQLCDPKEIEYIIVNHTEPDHSGSLKKMLAIAPNATVLGSSSALRFLKDQIGSDFPQQVLKDDDIIDLGDKKIRAISAPNLHWPDSIFTYLEEEKVLFTCDSFGAHFCHEAMYDELVGDYNDAFQYYFDVILKPFSKFFLRAIDKIKPLEIKAICTGHGPLLISRWKTIVDRTEFLCKEYLAGYPEKNRVLIAYVSAYGFTKRIAEIIEEGILEAEGVEVDFCDLEKTDAATLADKIAKASAYLLGSPTINQNMLPQLYNVFAMMSPIRDKDKLAGCFGSYGWSGEAEKDLISNIENMKLNYCGDSIFIKFKPQEYDYERIKNYGKKFGLLLKGQV